MSKNNRSFKFSPKYSAKSDTFFCTYDGGAMSWYGDVLVCSTCGHAIMVGCVDIDTARNSRIAYLTRQMNAVFATDIEVDAQFEQNALDAEMDRLMQEAATRRDVFATIRRIALASLAFVGTLTVVVAVIAR